MRVLFLLVGIILLGACKKDPPLWTIENLDPENKIVLLGHGGMGIESLYPMDSRESLEGALNIGADGTEMDIQLSKDGVLFLYHDLTLSTETSCDGSIAEHNADEINCRYKSIAHPGLKVIHLSDFLSSGSIDSTTTLTFDCKLGGNDPVYYEKFAKALNALINEFKLPYRCQIESTDPGFLAVLKKMNPNLRLFIYREQFSEAMDMAKENNLYGITMDMFRITTEQVKEAHARNFRVALFGQKTEHDNIQAVLMSPDYIQTDELKHLLKVFEKYKN